jgi:dTDP-4-amino-4,6-dideoxygalactose transaminase
MGYNARLDSLQAALLNVKLPLLDKHNAARRVCAAYYAEALNEDFLVERLGMRAPDPDQHPGHVFHQYVVRVRPELRDALRAFLKEHGVASAVYYPVGLHVQEFLGDHRVPTGALPNTEYACTVNLALPVFPGLSQGEQERVVDTVSRFAKQWNG